REQQPPGDRDQLRFHVSPLAIEMALRHHPVQRGFSGYQAVGPESRATDEDLPASTVQMQLTSQTSAVCRECCSSALRRPAKAPFTSPCHTLGGVNAAPKLSSTGCSSSGGADASPAGMAARLKTASAR